MGAPNFEPSKIPLNFEKESSEYLVEEHKVGSLSIGNPHAIVIQDEIKILSKLPQRFSPVKLS
jgi:diaminopimelate epimerase